MSVFKKNQQLLFFLLSSFLLYAAIPVNVLAQDLNLKAFVSKNQISSEDRFQYSVEVSGSSQNLPDVNFPDFKDFYVLSGPNSSTSIQFVNGVMSSSKTLSFILKPRKEGTLLIPEATVNNNGEVIQSNSITMTVSKAAPQTQQKKQAQKNPDQEISSENIFLKSEVSKRSAYVGEQVIIEYKLYFKNTVRTYEIEKNPGNAGFWTEEFQMPAQPLIENEIIDGVNYNVATLKKFAIFPTRVGEIILDPMVVNLEAVLPSKRNRRSLFDSFFDPPGKTMRKMVESKPIKMTIKSLPEKGKPKDYNGAVGVFRFEAKVDKVTANVNEAIALKIKLSGAGNIKLAEIPLVEIPPDIEQYDPKTNSNISSEGSVISGSKTAEYILIPRIPGEFTIKPMSFSYFDPQQKKYITKSSGAINLIITGEAAVGKSSPMAGFSRKEVELLGTDIRFIKEKTNFQSTTQRGYLTPLLMSGFSMALVLFIGFLFLDDKQAKLAGNRVLAKSRSASKLANKLLAEAKKNLTATDQSLFYKAINSALSRFVQDKLNLELTDFNTDNARNALESKNIDTGQIDAYIALLNECDFMHFAGTQSSEDEKKVILDRAREIITKMEKQL